MDPAPERSLRIVFLVRHLLYLRNFESAVRSLLDRGHAVHLLTDELMGDPPETPYIEPLVAGLCAEHPRFSHGPVPGSGYRGARPDGGLLVELRLAWWRTHLHYLDPSHGHGPGLRERVESGLGRWFPRFVRLPIMRGPRGRAALDRALARLERSLPTRRVVDLLLRDLDPDVVLATPLVIPHSPQVGYLRAAKRQGRPTVFCLHSWDNLTTKGNVSGDPDHVTVWNEIQAREAVARHGVDARRVVVTGAPVYDQWFSRGPARARAAFLEELGLPVDRPLLLYLCSSTFIAPDEASVVFDWLRRLRAAGGPLVREASVLVRPHWENHHDWEAAGVAEQPGVRVWPQDGAYPVAPEAKSDFYDSVFHSTAVVGVNTSALIESAIVGRPCLTLLTPGVRERQRELIHFSYLADARHGLLRVAESFEAHFEQLEGLFREGDPDAERRRRFVRDFVRPHGLDSPATPRLVATVEAAAECPPARPPTPRARPLAHLLLPPAAAALRWSVR